MQKISRKRFEWLKQKHYELWDWLSKNPEKSKEDWFKLDKNKGLKIAANCFACELNTEIVEACDVAPMVSACSGCPICKRTHACLNGLYDDYYSARSGFYMWGLTNEATRKRVIELSKQIRDLPWSEEYVEDKEMNNENYIVINGKKAELTEEQLKQLGIEADKKDKRWRAEEGGKFFFVDRSCIDSRFDIRCALDNYSYDTHNYFQTEEEAKKYAEVLEIKRQLMKFADEHNSEIDWKDSQILKWHLYCSEPTETITIGYTYHKKAETIYFSSQEIARRAMDTIGKDNIIKYLTYNY